MTTVGIVGVGLLGHAVATRLLAAGHRVIGYDVARDRVEKLVGLGGEPADSAEAVARAADPVLVVLPSLASVEAAILGPRGVLSGAPAGTTVVQMSTISPALTDRLGREAAARGVSFLDCPVSGTSAMVARGDGILLVGGNRALADRWRPFLGCIVPKVVYLGTVGLATVAKLVANLLVGVHTAAAAEALNLARIAGLDLSVMLDVLTTGAASSRMLEVRGPLIIHHDFTPQMKVELFLKDFALILEAGERFRAPLPLTAVARRLCAEAKDAGHAGDDLSAIVTTLEHDTSGKS